MYRQQRHSLNQCSNSPIRCPRAPRVSREIEHDGYAEMPGRTRVETRALLDASLDYVHHHSLLSMMDHAALVSTLAKRESSIEAVCQQSTVRADRASDLNAPNSVFDVEMSPHGNVWRQSTDQELSGRLLDGTCTPAPA